MSSLTAEQLKALEDVKLIENLAKDSKLVLFKHIKENKKDFQELVDKLEITDEKILEIQTELSKSLEEKVAEVIQIVEDIELLEPKQGEKGDSIKGDKGEQGKDGRDGLNGIDGLDGLNGKEGEKGTDGDDGKQGEQGDDGSPDTPKDIKKKLEKLKGDKRLDAKAVKNLNKYVNGTVSSMMSIDMSKYLKLDQTTPQTIYNGLPLLEATRTIDADNQIVDKKYVDDAVEVENLWDRTGTVLSPHTAGDDITTTGDITATNLVLGTGDAIIAGDFVSDTTLTFKCNLNSGDNAFRMQFAEQYIALEDKYASGGYIQYNSDGNYLEFGGIENNDPYPDVPGFRIARDTGKPTFVAAATFSGGIENNVNYTGSTWDFNEADVTISGNINGTPTFTALTTFSNDVVFDDIVEFNSSVSSHLVADYTNPAYLNINGPSNGVDCSTLGLYESGGTAYGMYMKYNGSSNIGYIGTTNNSVQVNAISLSRGSANVSFLGDGYFSGNVGIGTDDPDAKLQVSGGDIYIGKDGVRDSLLRIYSDTAGNYFEMKNSGNVVTFRNAPNANQNFYIDSKGSSGYFTVSTRDRDVFRLNKGLAFGSTYYTASLNENEAVFEGNVGIGTDSPTSLLHLGAGTTTNPPLKFTSGTSLTTPEAGALEYDGCRLLVTNVATQKAIDRTSDVAVATVTVAETTTETTLWTGLMPANSLCAGNVFKFHCDGKVSNDGASSSDEVTIRLKVGGVTKVTLNPNTKSLTDVDWHINVDGTQRTIGASGQRAIHAHMVIGDPISTGDEVGLTAVATIDTTASMDVTVTAEWASSDVNNTISLYQGFMEYKN